MDAGLYALVSALGVNIIIFSILFMLFLVYRKFRSKHVISDDPKLIPKNAIYSESDTPLKALFTNVYHTSLDDIYDKCGLESYIYLSLHYQIIIGLAIMALSGLIVLIPIYTSGNSVDGTSLLKTGIANIQREGNYMIGPLVFYVAFSVFGYYFVNRILINVKKKTQSQVNFI